MAATASGAIRRGYWRALDRKTRGAALVEQDGAARTAGNGLGQRGAGARAGTEVREARGRPRAGIGTTGSGGAARRAWTPCATASSKVAREDS